MATKKRAASGKSVKDYVRFSTKVQESLDEMSAKVGEYAATMDAVQEVSLDLTRLASSLAATAGEYAEAVNSILQKVLPFITGLPILDKKTQGFLASIQKSADALASVAKGAQTLTAGAEQGLLSGDAERLQALAPELKKLPQTIAAALKSLKN